MSRFKTIRPHLGFFYCLQQEADSADTQSPVEIIQRPCKEAPIGAIDEALEAHRTYAEAFTLGHLTAAPARKLVVVSCMDARMNLEAMLGLKTGDAHIIRNAGGIVTDDVLRSLLISHYLLYTQEFMLINHHDCGLMKFKDDELRSRLQQISGTATIAPASFLPFTNLQDNVRQQVQKVKSHPWVPKSILVRGFVYEESTGRLNEVMG